MNLELKESILEAIEEHWGPRCLIKDTDDLLDDIIPVSDFSRCDACIVYEKFDEFWKKFDPES